MTRLSLSLSEVRAKGGPGQRGGPVGTGDMHLYPVEGNHWDGLTVESIRRFLDGDSAEVVEAESPGWDTQADFTLIEEGRVDNS